MAIEISSWMRQNMKKSGGSSAAGSSKKAVVRMADGGDVSEAEDKAAGLAASSGEKVGFFERLRMGNIDDPKSEAYSRFGAGRAKADRDMENEAAAMRAVDNARASAAAPKAAEPDMGAFNEAGSGTVNDSKPSAPAPVASPVAKPKPRPARNAVRASASKPAAPVAPKVADAPDESAAETARLNRPRTMPSQTDAKSERLTPQGGSRKYETPYDRMNRVNRENADAARLSREDERAKLRENIRNRGQGEVDPKTLLPK
jgi:hypothetical protein